jgi:cytochrome c-type biogenesis protein CcmH/NrfG
MFLRRLPLCRLVLALGVLQASAQVRHVDHAIFSLSGSVRDGGSQRPMAGILVTLKRAGDAPVAAANTSQNGDFFFDGLINDSYIIEISVKDYEPVRETATISGGNLVGISISLTRNGKVMIPASQMSISAHQLSVPHKAHDEFEKGMELIYLKADYRGAIAQFQLAIKDFPTYYEAYAEEGNSYYRLQEIGPAEEALRKSVDLSSGQYADAKFTLASILNDTKRFTEAETLSRQGIAVDSSSWRGPFELGRALTALKQMDEAEKNAQKSRDLMPDNAPVYLLLANIHIMRKDFPALIRDLDEFLRLAPNSPEADQARKTRERVQSLLDSTKNESASGGKEKPPDDEEDVDPATDKDPPPRAAPDTSGLPSLPPPTK